jgi:hypothetical protein
MGCTLVKPARTSSRILVGVLVVVGATFFCSRSRAGNEPLPTPPQSNALQSTPPQSNAPPDLRWGGVIEKSYYYHRQQPTQATLQPMRSCIEAGGIPQANGWYNYGFPMQSYRYGWFGAERHDPHMFWTKGYYGDEVRTAYRRSY